MSCQSPHPGALTTDESGTQKHAIPKRQSKKPDITSSNATSLGSSKKPLYTLADALRDATTNSTRDPHKRRIRPRKPVLPTQPTQFPGLAHESSEVNDEPAHSPPRKKAAAPANDEFYITVQGTVPAGKTVVVRIE